MSPKVAKADNSCSMPVAPSAEQALHVLDQCFCPQAPGGAIQAEFLRFIVLATLFGKGGEGSERQELVDLDTCLLQQHQQTGDVMAVGRLDAEMP